MSGSAPAGISKRTFLKQLENKFRTKDANLFLSVALTSRVFSTLVKKKSFIYNLF
jgi:hypothetical protein